MERAAASRRASSDRAVSCAPETAKAARMPARRASRPRSTGDRLPHPAASGLLVNGPAHRRRSVDHAGEALAIEHGPVRRDDLLQSLRDGVRSAARVRVAAERATPSRRDGGDLKMSKRGDVPAPASVAIQRPPVASVSCAAISAARLERLPVSAVPRARGNRLSLSVLVVARLLGDLFGAGSDLPVVVGSASMARWATVALTADGPHGRSLIVGAARRIRAAGRSTSPRRRPGRPWRGGSLPSGRPYSR